MYSKAAHIVLVGLPGSGKSTLGKELARKMDLPFVDLDAAIEEREGLPVAEIFSKKGEDFFRQLEAESLRTLLETVQPMVLATGGGAPCFFHNMGLINQKGCSVYLEVSFEALAQRLLAQGVAKRPLLEGVASRQELVELLERKFSYRIPFYKKADLHYHNTAAAHPEALLKEIKACLEARS